MKRKYNEALLTAMKANEKVVVYKGVKVLVKPIPEGGACGDMDPRLYKSMRLFSLITRFAPKKKKAKSQEETILQLRKMFNTYKGIQLAEEGIKTEYVTVDSTEGYQVPVRVYRRDTAGSDLPILVYFHGGGFFGGSADIVEQMCKVLIQKLDCVVFNVDYRLCPENRYPQPFDDCYYATEWAYKHAHQYGGDKNKLVVSGDSAGGNLAAAVTLRDREEKANRVKLQALIYPSVNIARKQTEFYKGVDHGKYRRSKKHEKVFNASLRMMGEILPIDSDENLLADVYLQGQLGIEPIYTSPLLDDMHDLPPTVLIFGEHDFLAFEDFAYAQTITKAKRQIKTIVYRGLGHGFADQIGVFPQAEDCMGEIADFMKAIFSVNKVRSV